jgi:uncharacterized protein (TIGR02145 family)
MKPFLSLLCIFVLFFASAQKSDIELSFTALDNATYIKLDSIKIINRIQGEMNMLYWPDTSISINNTAGDLYLFVGYISYDPAGIEYPELPDTDFELSQSYPNPVLESSKVNLYLPDNGTVQFSISSLNGRVQYTAQYDLEKGMHTFQFLPGGERFYLITARWNGITKSIKIISEKQNPGKCSLQYSGTNQNKHLLKQKSKLLNTIVKESGISDIPIESKTYAFQFTEGGPCPGIPSVEYGGQTYNTVQIFSQCWLKENLNIGNMIPGNESMTDNGITEKFCFENQEDSCTKYGGLYEWNEMMQYVSTQGSQGICPAGWHIPTDEEWKILEGAVDSLYGIGDPIWDLEGHDRGLNAGNSLKSSYGWYNGHCGSNVHDFSALPGGNRVYPGNFILNTRSTIWWTSDMILPDDAWTHGLNFGYSGADRENLDQYIIGASVRCLKD